MFANIRYSLCLMVFPNIFPQNGLVLGVYKDGDKCTLSAEASRFNDTVGGRLIELMQWYVLISILTTLWTLELYSDTKLNSDMTKTLR